MMMEVEGGIETSGEGGEIGSVAGWCGDWCGGWGDREWS